LGGCTCIGRTIRLGGKSQNAQSDVRHNFTDLLGS
jgi:hypothetical protein